VGGHVGAPHQLIALDVGTQGVRACVFAADGTRVAERTEAYPTSFPRHAQAEQDPEDWWRAAVAALREVARAPGVDRERLVALSYACTSCTVVALDGAGRALRPAILWMDERAAAEADAITATGDPVLRYSGGKVSPQWMLPKTLWLMRHEPEVFARAFRIVEQTDFFTHRLTGEWTLSHNNLVAKWNYARPLGGWPAGFLERAGVAAARARWPERFLHVGTPIGPLREDVAAATGLPRLTVVQGGIDSHAGMVGASVVEPGELAVIMGTSTVVMGQSDRPVFADNWGPYPDALIPGTFTLGGGQTTTGSIFQWLLGDIAGVSRDALGETLARLDAQARALPPGSGGLVALDYFQGNRTPRKDPRARGALVGLTLWHGLPHVLRAFHEAIAFGTRHIFENLESHGFAIRRVVAGGGGARSGLAVQILADACGRPVQRVLEPEITAAGAAIWAALGAGLFPDHRAAVAAMVRTGETITPCAAHRADYDFYFARYLAAYDRLRPLVHEVVDFEARRAAEGARA
jgi:FGGY-family pentulose kinase